MAYERDPGAGNSGGGNGDLSVDDDSLLGFKKRLDEVLTRLNKSQASSTKVREQTLTRDAYGGSDLGSADLLSTEYNRVHTRLENFSRVFGEQIEALGIAIQISQKGYAGVDADQLARMRQIQANAAQYYRAPDAPSNGSDAQATDTDQHTEL